MYSSVTSCAMVGVEPRAVRIETAISGGRGGFSIVGLPDAAVREARERVRSAIRQQGFSFPAGRVTVNLSPADVPKQGSTYDLPMALSILAARLGKTVYVMLKRREPFDQARFLARAAAGAAVSRA